MNEPNFLVQIVAVWVLPYIAYFTGMYIRKKVLPGPKSPSLSHQVLLGIPVSLIVVSPLLTSLRHVISTDLSAYLINMGIIVEHGMLLQETLTRHLMQRRRQIALSATEM